MFYRPAGDIRRGVGCDLRTHERFARDHSETQGGNR